jgi:hypothetical protein
VAACRTSPAVIAGWLTPNDPAAPISFRTDQDRVVARERNDGHGGGPTNVGRGSSARTARSQWSYTLLRRGRVVVRLLRHPAIAAPAWWFEQVLEAFSDADDRWLFDECTTALTGAEVIADRVSLTVDGEPAGNDLGGAAIVARNRRTLNRIGAVIGDDELKCRLSDPGLADKTVILMTSLAAMTTNGEARIIDLGRLSTESNNATQLDIDVDDVRRKTGTLLAVDALEQTPTRLFLTVTNGYPPSMAHDWRSCNSTLVG